MAKGDQLTPKQQRFIDEYLIDLNATQAAIRAGYSFSKNIPPKYYVYFLIDPRDNKIFYVGKGKGKRIYSHCKKSNHDTCNFFKIKKIQEIEKSGHCVSHVFFSNYEIEGDAFDCEREVIGRFKKYGLMNIAGGSTSPIEKIKAHAQTMINKIKQKKQWVLSLPKNFEDQIFNIFQQTPSEFYDSIRDNLNSILTQHERYGVDFEYINHGKLPKRLL